MRIEIKLYSYHDLDLVSLYKTGRIAFPETTRQVLNSYARKEVYKVRLLPLNEDRAAKYPQKMYRKFYHYHVDLDEVEDADAIRLIKMITEGYRNNFIKSVLRQYLCGVFIEEYSKDGSANFFNEMSRRIQGDRDERDIKQVKRKAKKEKKQNGKTPRHKAQKIENDAANIRSLAADVDGVSGSTYASDYLEVNGQQKVDRGFPSIDETKAADKIEQETPKEPIREENKEFKKTVETTKEVLMPTVENADKTFDNASALGSKTAEQFEQTARHLEQPKPNFADTKIEDTSSFEDNEDSELDDFLDGLTEQY